VYLKDQIFPQINTMFGSNSQAETVVNTVDMAFGALDVIFLFITIFMGIASILMASQVENHPAFLFVNILLLAILLAIAPAISNAMRTLMSDPAFVPYTEGGGGSVEFVITANIFQYLPLVLGGLGFILSIAQFAKGRTA
jgi:hypothetical protein